jgi:PPE-repeat protein
MLPDFVVLPPEINSARMYAGPGSGSMWAAAAAWDGLATDLGSSASSFQSVASGLTGAAWQGPASVSMAAAATPYVGWLNAAAAQAGQAAAQARAAAGAFETAFGATVPPALIAANRAQLMSLVATNVLGQNTPAIATAEAQYEAMWAQDVTAMSGYDANTLAVAAQLTPFSEPPTGLAGAAAQAAAASAATQAQSVISTGPQLLSALPQSLGLSSSSTSGLSSLNMLSTPAESAMSPISMLMGQMGQHMSSTNPLANGAIGGMPAMGSTLTSEVGSRVGALSPAGLGGSAVSAGLGRAGSVGALSVPASWATAVPATTPSPAVAGMPGTGMSQLAASVPATPFTPPTGMAGRALGGGASPVAAPRASVIPRTVFG